MSKGTVAATATTNAATTLPYCPGFTRKQILASAQRSGMRREGINKRRCSVCGSNKTRLKNVNRWHLIDGSKYARYPHWYKSPDVKGGFICFNCYQRAYMRLYLRRKNKEKEEKERKKKL